VNFRTLQKTHEMSTKPFVLPNTTRQNLNRICWIVSLSLSLSTIAQITLGYVYALDVRMCLDQWV